MPDSPLNSSLYLAKGIRMILRPGLRRYVFIPLSVNILVFALLIALLFLRLSDWTAYVMTWLPNWTQFLYYPLWLVFAFLILLVGFFTFTMVGNLIAAPFNSFLSERVEAEVTGKTDNSPFNWSEITAPIPHALKREIRKLFYFLPRTLGLLILSLIPVLNIIAVPLWLLFGSWMMALQFIDYPADNHKLSWSAMYTWLKQIRMQSLGFGISIYLCMLIPFLNLLVIPSAIAAATLFWLEKKGTLPPSEQAQKKTTGT